MAIQWGGYAGHFRLGIDAIVSGTNLTLVVYGENQSGYSHAWNSTLTFTGGWGGSKAVAINVGLGVTRRELHRWSTSYTGTKTFSNSMPIPYWGGTASVSRAVTLSPPPVPKPAAPSGLAVTRVSDTQHTLNWSRNSTYTSVKVYRGTGDGKFSHIGTASGNAYTYTDKGTKANGRYYYYVVGVNAGGSSGNSNTAGPVYTTPAAPSGQTAVRQASSIVVNATGRPPYATSYDIEDNGTVVATSVALPWTHAAPSTTTTHRYRIRAKRGSLTGGWSGYTGTVQLLTPPKAPTKLNPNGLVRAVDEPVELGWTHNPVDASPQSAAEVRWRVDGGGWTTLTGTASASLLLELPVGLIEWQVRTKGAHANFGEWSAVATVNVIDRPVVDVTQPGPVWDQPVLRAAWTYEQAQGRPQSAWQIELRSITAAALDSLSGSGATSAATFKARVIDDEDYVIALRAATGEVWSEWALFEFRAEFIPPAPPQLIAGWVEEVGAASVEVNEGEADPSSTEEPPAAAVAFMIERSVDSGITWEFVADELLTESMVPDWECLSFGETLYRGTAFAATGASAETIVSVVAESEAMWLSGGESLELAARLPYDPELDLDVGRRRTVHRFSGRELGVVMATEQVESRVQASGTLFDDDRDNATKEQMLSIARSPAPVHMYRDPDGRRVFGLLGNVQVRRVSDGEWGFSFAIEETER